MIVEPRREFYVCYFLCIFKLSDCCIFLRIGGVDFEATSGQLIFDSTTTVLSFPVTILNDTLAEGPEEFLLQLTTTEQRVILDPPQMDVEIIDHDGKLKKKIYVTTS